MKKIYVELEQTIAGFCVDDIAPERQVVLKALASTLAERELAGQSLDLMFICTHNSRRSVLAQVWAAMMACRFGVPALRSYSGGTEATAVYEQVLSTLAAEGFRVEQQGGGHNPRYLIHFSDSCPPVRCFSKQFASEVNPRTSFVAVMTCSAADEACPVVPGAVARYSLPYDDPKAYDERPEKEAMYHERSLQIARELWFVFKQFAAARMA